MKSHSKPLYGLIISALTLGALGALVAQAQDRVPGRLLVGLREDGAGAASGVLARHGLKMHRRSTSSRVAVVTVDAGAADQVAGSLRASGQFRYVEPDYYAHSGRTPNDNLFLSEWYLKSIQAEAAWDTTTGAAGTTIAFIDSGVDATHPDLAGRLVAGHSFLDGSDDTSDTMGHGTAVAGVLGASADNAQGVAGVTWTNPLMPLVVVDSQDRAAYSDIIDAIHYAADNGVRVVNISLGGLTPSDAMQEAVDYAWSKGTLIFAAAMNQSIDTPYYPGACSHVIAVSATDSLGGLAAFSNYGKWVTLSAPGAMIMSTARGGGYSYWNGTSFASPIAAGVAALVVSVNPALTAPQVVDILKQSADDLGARGYDIFYGWGRVNAARAVEAALATLPASTPADAAAAADSAPEQPIETNSPEVLP